MDAEQVARRVRKELAEITELDLEPDSIRPDMSLREDLALHSLEAVTLVMDLEDEYDVELDDDEVQSLNTVGDVISMIVAKAS